MSASSTALPAFSVSPARPQVAPQCDPLLSIEELAAYLNVSKWAIYNLISRKKSDIPRIRIGREWRFRKSSIDRWLAAQERVQ